MTNVKSDPYPKVATSAAIAGAATVFLVAIAALLNAALSHAPLPSDLHDGAVMAHLATVLLALPIGVAQLLLPKGTLRHRTMGYVWCALMLVTAIVSFAVHGLNPSGLSPIHLFSVLTLVTVPQIIIFARTGRVARHQRAVLGLMIGGLVIAGLFTFIPSRALGSLVFRMFGFGG